MKYCDISCPFLFIIFPFLSSTSKPVFHSSISAGILGVGNHHRVSGQRKTTFFPVSRFRISYHFFCISALTFFIFSPRNSESQFLYFPVPDHSQEDRKQTLIAILFRLRFILFIR